MVAAKLAHRVGYQVVDTDQRVVQLAGKSIAAIFGEDGEDTFRDLETVALRQAATETSVIIALGGGAVLREENRRIMKQAGPVVLLSAPPEVIRQRMMGDEATASQRPSLTGSGPLDEIERVLAERAPLYAAVADFAVETQSLSPDQIADRIQQRYFPHDEQRG